MTTGGEKHWHTLNIAPRAAAHIRQWSPETCDLLPLSVVLLCYFTGRDVVVNY